MAPKYMESSGKTGNGLRNGSHVCSSKAIMASVFTHTRSVGSPKRVTPLRGAIPLLTSTSLEE